ncbi:MAG: alpha/beta hydrolase-fold protein [Clostridia bacterium]|nr:alpha/beta hydrolase-fold protein [Clostridia bacterium]
MKRILSILVTLALMLGVCGTFAEEQGTPISGLTALKAEDPAQMAKLIPEFDPAADVYAMYVQSDVYGVRFTPEFIGDDEATVFMSGDGVDSKVVSVASGESFILDLTQQQSMYEREVVSTAVIAVSDKSYTINVHRGDGSALYDAFELLTYSMPDGHDMNYWLHIPEDYDANKEYPVVLYLHGGGQTRQEPGMILKRTQQATAFLAYGYEDAIIIAPHGNYTTMDSEVMGWDYNSQMYGTDEREAQLTVFGEGAYQILQNVKAEYSVDNNRVYVTGGSMGGGGTLAMIASYPEQFAAALACCSGTNTDKLVSALESSPVALWLVFGQGDPIVDYGKFSETPAALDAAGIPYNITVYDQNTFLYPTAHFSWMPAYADTEILAWMFSQHKSASENEIIDIKFEEGTQNEGIDFDPAVKEYEVTLQSDIYGVRVTPYGNGTFTVNDVEVKGGESYTLALSEDHGDYRKELVYDIVVKDADNTYTIKAVREDGSYHYDAFELNTFTLPDGKDMNYWLSVPSDYDATKEYPVVLALHGSGQRTQPPEMILQRSIQANAFVKNGYEAIIIAPQCNYTDLPQEVLSWCDEESKPTIFAQGAYDILQMIKQQYSIDADRVYITGLSNGGRGTQGLIAAYPDEFAAALIIAAYQEMTLSQWDAVVRSNIPLWFVTHVDDVMPAAGVAANTLKLKKLGYDYNLTVYPSTVYLAPTAHFSWVPAYDDSDILDWMFAQSK